MVPSKSWQGSVLLRRFLVALDRNWLQESLTKDLVPQLIIDSGCAPAIGMLARQAWS